jgi:hypothetical protein
VKGFGDLIGSKGRNGGIMRRSILLAIVISPSLSVAQAPKRVTLPPHDARFDQPFGTVIGVRELGDGRIIVADRVDLGLVVADFKAQTTKQISRKGGGPGEYGMLARIWPLGGDSTLMPDLTQRRWLILDGDRVVTTVPPDNPTVKATQGLFLGADAAGYVMRETYDETPVGQSATGVADSSFLVRYHRSTARVDTVARLMRRPSVSTRETNAKGETTFSSVRALRLRVGEQYIVHPDGWIAIVRINPFRVDWRSPEGRWTLGAPLPVPVIRMTEREKAASRARTAASQAANQSKSAPPLPPQLKTPDDEWPDVMPPYLQGEIVFSPDGDVIIRRQPSADHPGVAYYAVDRRGRLLGVLEMKNNERIVSGGRRWLYVVETDADDLNYIRRHPWPSVKLPG